MSVGTWLKRLEVQVEWLDENGELRLLEIEWKLLQMKEQISARDPALARRLGFLPEPAKPPQPAPRPLPILRDAPLRSAPQDEEVRIAPPPEPTKPHPEERPARRRLEGSEPAPRLQSILRDASLRSAPQDEVVRVEPSSPAPLPKPPEPAPPLVQPFNYDPPPEMQIRPVTWRRRGPPDYEDDGEDMYGKCIVDYDPLGYLDTDDD